jgi:two-component system chemotaxis sensor kinase CheA
MIEDRALLNEYLSESEQLLDLLLADLDLFSAEVKPGRTAKVSPTLVNRIFRAVHSLKGLSGMMGLVEVQSLAHEFEDVLDDLRLGRLDIDRQTVAGLQEAGAGFAALVGTSARGLAKEDDFRAVQERIAAVAQRRRERSREQDRVAGLIGLSDKERALLTEFEQQRINVNLEAGRQFYALTAQLPIATLDSRYRALTGKLDGLGELITTLPGVAGNPELAELKFVIATELKESDIRAGVGDSGVRVERLGQSAWRRAGKALKSVSRIQRVPGLSALTSESRTAGLPGTREAQVPGREGVLRAVLPPSTPEETLRPLLAGVRVELSQIDDLSSLAHELSIETKNLSGLAGSFMSRAGSSPRERFDLKQTARRIERRFVELEERLVELRMVSLAQTFDRAARLARRLARELGKAVTVEATGRSTQLDKMIVDRLADAIHHVLRNAVDHGIETPDVRRFNGKPPRGAIKLGAVLEGTRAVIEITDDGLGIDAEAVRQRAVEIGAVSPDEELTEEETLRLIFRPGFSTAGEVSAVSGRGVGLDAVERTMNELGGEIRVSSASGKGCRFELAVPTTLQMISAFVVRAEAWLYAVNVGQIAELLYASPEDLSSAGDRTSRGLPARRLRWKGMAIPFVPLHELLGLTETPSTNCAGVIARQRARNGANRVPALITRVSDRPVAVAVDSFEGQREIIVKSLGSIGRRIRGIVGAVDLEGGDVALVVDLPSLLSLKGIKGNGKR